MTIFDEDETMKSNFNKMTGILCNTLIQLKRDCFINAFIGGWFVINMKV